MSEPWTDRMIDEWLAGTRRLGDPDNLPTAEQTLAGLLRIEAAEITEERESA